jgi:hypothetical protein
MGVGGRCHAPAALPLGMKAGTHFTGSYVNPMAGLGEWGKSRRHQDSTPERYSL